MVVLFLFLLKSMEVHSRNSKVLEVHLPVSETASLSMTAEVGDRQKAAKK